MARAVFEPRGPGERSVFREDRRESWDLSEPCRSAFRPDTVSPPRTGGLVLLVAVIVAMTLFVACA